MKEGGASNEIKMAVLKVTVVVALYLGPRRPPTRSIELKAW
ncbi:MAG: hypothetical protein ACRDLB_04335 [Actinomycetota bacterium]